MTVSTLTNDRLNIHQVTLMQCDFRQSIECLARHGITHTAVWREKLDEIGLSEAQVILRDHNMTIDALCAGGFVTEDTSTDFVSVTDSNRRWLDQAATLGARSLVTITGGFSEGSKDLSRARARAVEGIERLIPHARATGVKLAIEPLHPMVCGYRSVISTVSEALDLLDTLDANDVLGLAIDSYAVWWEPGLQDAIARAGNRILHFHVSDWLRDTESVRLDRGMPGDGVIENRKIRSWIEAAGYFGQVEVEIFSEKNWWQRPVDEVVETILTRMGDHL